MAFQTIGFIGLGLIGGSIAKKMKSNQPDIKIYATAHHKETKGSPNLYVVSILFISVAPKYSGN